MAPVRPDHNLRKIWDTFSGAALHSFPHNHIVRSVAFSPSTSHLLTGGQEKKVRLFDLRRPDADPEFLGDAGGSTAHQGTVKSVVWINDWNCVTAGEDGAVKYVICCHSPLSRPLILRSS